MSFSVNAGTPSENFQQLVINFEAGLRTVNSQIQQLPILSKQTKDEFQFLIDSHINWLESKRIEALNTGLTEGQFATLSLEVYAKMVTIAHEVTLELVTKVYIEAIDGVIVIAQSLIIEAPKVVAYFELKQCQGTEDLTALITQGQQNLDAAKQSHEATKQKAREITPGISISEELKILAEIRSLAQQTINYLKEVQRIYGDFNLLMQQIAANCRL